MVGEGLQGLESLPHSLCEFVVQFRQYLLLDGKDFHVEPALFAGVVLLGVIVRNGQCEFLGLSFGHALQINGEARKGEVVVYLGNEVYPLVIDDPITFDRPFDVHGHQVTKGQRAFHRFPGSRLKPQVFQYVFHLFVGDFHRLPL